MNDFSEIESELRKLRPIGPSAELVSRIEQDLAAPAPAQSEEDKIVRPDRFRMNWISVGVGLAAAAILLLLVRVNFQTGTQPQNRIASTPVPGSAAPMASAQFIPAGATHVVYNTRDEGLHYPTGATEPVRRLRSRTRETLQWRNPETGASLRISYPTEQVDLIPVSGQ
jgi:hypothetical protein